jgi:hypothetical protein
MLHVLHADPCPPLLILRIEALEAAIATALKVNQALSTEVERFAHSSSQLQGERDAWLARARKLAQRHSALRKEQAGCPDDAEELARYLELQEQRLGSGEVPSTSGMAVEPTPPQLKAMSSLLSRGRAAGWLIEPSEVSTMGVGARMQHEQLQPACVPLGRWCWLTEPRVLLFTGRSPWERSWGKELSGPLIKGGGKVQRLPSSASECLGPVN